MSIYATSLAATSASPLRPQAELLVERGESERSCRVSCSGRWACNCPGSWGHDPVNNGNIRGHQVATYITRARPRFVATSGTVPMFSNTAVAIAKPSEACHWKAMANGPPTKRTVPRVVSNGNTFQHLAKNELIESTQIGYHDLRGG